MLTDILLEEQIVILFDLQVVVSFQTVNDSVCASMIFQSSFLLGCVWAKTKDLHANSVDQDEFVIFWKEHTKALWFPKLESFMSENQVLLRVCWYIHAHHRISIDEDRFIANNQLLYTISSFLSQHTDIAIANIQLVFNLYQEHIMFILLTWIIFTHSEHKEA